MDQNGLARRIEALERYQPWGGGVAVSFEAMARRFAQMAEHYRGRPAPPVALQSLAEKTVRAGLAAAAGAEGSEYARRFWQAVAVKLREYRGRGPS